MSRRACVLAAAVAAGVLCGAAPAAADVTVSPPVAPRGAGANETFRVVNDHPKAAMTKIRLVLPEATPVAEVYPLSVPDWAPQITSRTLNPPMRSLHGGSPVSEATASITWTAAPGKALKPGKAADVMIAIGPLPDTDQMSFEVQATYADGSAGPAIAPVVLRLIAPPAAPGEEPVPLLPLDIQAAPGGPGPGPWTTAAWVIALVTGVAGVVALVRSRRTGNPSGTGAPSDPDPRDTDAAAARGGASRAPGVPGPVGDAAADDPDGTAAKARVTAWSYRDGP
jgi:uncharacterized protein YcnI